MPLILLFISGFVSAFSIHVEGLRPYDLKTSKNSLELSSPHLSARINYRKCSEKMLKDFDSSLHRLKTGSPLIRGSARDSLNFSLNGVKYFERTGSLRARQLLAVPSQVERLILEESLSCKK